MYSHGEMRSVTIMNRKTERKRGKIRIEKVSDIKGAIPTDKIEVLINYI